MTYKIKFLEEANKPDVELESLTGADLCYANLRNADLSYANLRYTKLRYTNLRCTNLRYANLRNADLRCADLYGANLCNADLRSANLRNADLRCADLYGAHLRNADPRNADLYGANLCNADLCNAKNAKLVMATTLIVPQQGAFVGWKKLANGTIAELLIPISAARSNATGRKCRAAFVEVLALYAPKSEDELPADYSACAYHDSKIFYTKGITVRAHAWEPDRFIECAAGIHFFLTREEAEAYVT